MLPANYYAEGPEALLVSLASKRDREAFEELVRRRQSWIRNLLRRLTNDPEMADDLAQQAFLQAWRRIRQVREPDKFAGWLRRIAVNEWTRQLRKSDPLWRAEAMDDRTTQARPGTAGIVMDLDTALATLPYPVRLCVILSYSEQLTHAEIARVTALPPGTVKSHIRRGSRKLRDILSAYGDSV